MKKTFKNRRWSFILMLALALAPLLGFVHRSVRLYGHFVEKSKNSNLPRPAPTFIRYRFSEEILRSLRPYFNKDNWHGIVWCAWDWIIIGVVIGVSLWAWETLNVLFAAFLYLWAVVIIGSRQRALAALLHDSAHRILTKNRWLNFLVGTFGSGYLVLQSFSGYRDSHVKKHHPYLGHPSLDPDYYGIKSFGLYGDGLNGRNVRRYLLSLILPAAT